MRNLRWVFVLLILFVSGCSAQSGSVEVPPTEAAVYPPSPAGKQTMSTGNQTSVETATRTALPAATQTSEPRILPYRIAYISENGNVAIVGLFEGERILVTEDSSPFSIDSPQEQETITYCCPKWSFDGRYLAFWQGRSAPNASAYRTEYRLRAVDVSTNETIDVLQESVIVGYDWRPGSYEIAFDTPIDIRYFIEEREANATGIHIIDIQNGNQRELVSPENGYALAGPIWSVGGQTLTFSEILYMEGSGPFAYYDFSAGRYHSTEEVIGSYSLSPNGEWIAFDRISYLPAGDERIWVREWDSEKETRIPPNFERNGYAFSPVFSPDGERIAYFAALDGPESLETSVFTYQFSTGETSNLGSFSQGSSLSWSPDGRFLVLAAGTFEDRGIWVIDTDRAEFRLIEKGQEPIWQPQ